jgi:two-component system chemotaxis response regulator CheB
MARIFIIASTPATADFILKSISAAGEHEIVRLALHGEEVLQQLSQVDADIVAIDGSIPRDELKDVTQSIMYTKPLPLVILGTRDATLSVRDAVETLDIGALSVLDLPASAKDDDFAKQAMILSRNLRLMAELKVVRRWDSKRFDAFYSSTHPPRETFTSQHPIDIVAIGGSAGGTKGLQCIFNALPADFPLPVLVVQHIAKGYVEGLARWLADQSALSFVVAEEGTALKAGVVYLASDDRHLTVASDHRILLSDDESVNGFRPSIARLFSSVHDVFGAGTAAVLLSGMGNDGAKEMRQLFDIGASTIAQDKETSLIHGIPGEAIKLAAARFILPVHEISPALQVLARKGRVVRSV